MALAAMTSLTGVIPVVVTGGVIMKMTEAAMPRRNGYGYAPRRQRSRSAPRRRRRQPTFGGVPMPGNFSNVGF